jgi:hypothetical protein
MIVGGIAWLDARYMHVNDVVATNLMSQSTRYAEIEKYYTDLLLEGAELTESQMKRLRLAQEQQVRIAGILLGDSP